MRSRDLTPGRMLGVTFDHGDDFFHALTDVCRSNGIRQGYIPVSSPASAPSRSSAPART